MIVINPDPALSWLCVIPLEVTLRVAAAVTMIISVLTRFIACEMLVLKLRARAAKLPVPDQLPPVTLTCTTATVGDVKLAAVETVAEWLGSMRYVPTGRVTTLLATVMVHPALAAKDVTVAAVAELLLLTASEIQLEMGSWELRANVADASGRLIPSTCTVQ